MAVGFGIDFLELMYSNINAPFMLRSRKTSPMKEQDYKWKPERVAYICELTKRLRSRNVTKKKSRRRA